MFLPNPGVLAAAAAAGLKTYADYLAWTETQGATEASPDSNPRSAGHGWKSVTLGSSFGGTMWGSSWGSWFTDDSNFSRIIQHGFPTQAFATANLGRRVLIQTANYGTEEWFYGQSRNSYQSMDYTTFAAAFCPRLRLFNDATGKIVDVLPISSTWSETDF